MRSYTIKVSFKFLDWEKFYIGNKDDSACRFDSKVAEIDFQGCGTTTNTVGNEIIHENMVEYEAVGPFNFFTGFDVRCVTSQNLNITMGGGESELVIDISDVSMVQDMKDEINLSDHVALTLFNVPEGKLIKDHSRSFKVV